MLFPNIPAIFDKLRKAIFTSDSIKKVNPLSAIQLMYLDLDLHRHPYLKNKFVEQHQRIEFSGDGNRKKYSFFEVINSDFHGR